MKISEDSRDWLHILAAAGLILIGLPVLIIAYQRIRLVARVHWAPNCAAISPPENWVRTKGESLSFLVPPGYSRVPYRLPYWKKDKIAGFAEAITDGCGVVNGPTMIYSGALCKVNLDGRKMVISRDADYLQIWPANLSFKRPGCIFSGYAHDQREYPTIEAVALSTKFE